MTIEDGYGREITLKAAPRRIISLAPSVTEILYALNAGNRLVGNTKFCVYPVEAQSIYKIGDMRHPDLELMVQLRPSLVLGSVLSPLSLYNRMEAAGFTAIALAHTDWDGVLSDIGTIGKLIGVPGEALRLLREIQEKRNQILEKIKPLRNQPPQRVALLYDLSVLQRAVSQTTNRTERVQPIVIILDAVDQRGDRGVDSISAAPKSSESAQMSHDIA